jgi:F0F1-type ATP synthase epsilon subunit
MAADSDAKPAASGSAAASGSSAATTEQGQAPANSKKPTMKAKVYAPFQVYFEGDVYSITATNETGPFDILPKHHNFLCMLVPCDLILKTPYETKTIKIARALMHVRSERVVVFVDV